DREEPVIALWPRTNVFDGVPKLLPIGRISKKTPIIILAKQVIGARWRRGFRGWNRLASREQRAHKRHHYENRQRSHASLRFNIKRGPAVFDHYSRDLFARAISW